MIYFKNSTSLSATVCFVNAVYIYIYHIYINELNAILPLRLS